MQMPNQLSNRQLGIFMAGWITWHTSDTRRIRPFTVGDTEEVTELANGDKVYPRDSDFKSLIIAGYIEQIDETTYMLTNDANDLFVELTTLYRSRSAGADAG